MPSLSVQLLDSEFADDTTLYMHGKVENLVKLERALNVFGIGSGARLNWNKTIGFWIGNCSVPNWCPHPQFRWIPEGESVRYLGCQVGVNISPATQLVPLLNCIRRKLLYWSSKRLTWAGRIVIVNHVLLSTMWHATSCWIFVRSTVGQIQRLIRNFLWSGGEGAFARAKVAWSTLTLPKSKGGLGLIDPENQSKAMLAKLLVRGLLPGNETWKMILQS